MVVKRLADPLPPKTTYKTGQNTYCKTTFISGLWNSSKACSKLRSIHLVKIGELWVRTVGVWLRFNTIAQKFRVQMLLSPAAIITLKVPTPKKCKHTNDT